MNVFLKPSQVNLIMLFLTFGCLSEPLRVYQRDPQSIETTGIADFHFFDIWLKYPVCPQICPQVVNGK